jgi:hypothetical protein
MSFLVFGYSQLPPTPAKTAVISVIAVVIVAYIITPNFLYETQYIQSRKRPGEMKEKKMLRNLGLKESDTLMPLWLLSFIIGASVYFINLYSMD